MSNFRRNLNLNLINKLKSEKLFKEKISDGIRDKEIFPAIRRGDICFYHKGGRLLKYTKNGKFKTHKKYISLLDLDNDDSYINPEDLKNPYLNKNFIQAFESIKERSALYAGREAEGVAEIYEQFPYTHFDKTTGNSVVLDIEIGITPKSDMNFEEKNKTNYIDMLLFNVNELSLKFVEVKEFTNSDIKANDEPEVVKQIKRYNRVIENNTSLIISAYERYIDIVNNLLNLQLSKPEEVEKECGLLIFNFDAVQKSSDIKKSIERNLNNHDIYPYFIGNMSSLESNILWNKV